MLRRIRLLLFILFGVIFVVFAVANRQSVELSLFPLPYSAQMPVFLLSMVCFMCGVVIAGIILSGRSAKSRRLFAAEHKRVLALQNELEGVKAERESIASLSQ